MAHNPSDENDLVQETFLKAWLHLASFRAEASFRTWVMQVARNEVLQLYRREQHSPFCPALSDLDRFTSSFESPLRTVERGQTTQLVRSGLAQLPAMYREVLILRDLEELTQTETARWLNTNIPKIKTRLFRARRLLLNAIERTNRRKMPSRVGILPAETKRAA